MANLNRKRFQFLAPADHEGCYSKTTLGTIVCAVVVLGIIPPCLSYAKQQEPSNLQYRKVDLEVQKLELELAILREDRGEPPKLLTGVLGLLVGVVGTAASLWVARRSRFGNLDQSVHDKRLELYPKLVKSTAQLAVYFPSYDSSASIGSKECGEMGQAISRWYFKGGGLLLSVRARDAYFKLARALTRASLTKDLKVPEFPKDAEEISVEQVDKYRAELARRHNLDDVENWSFGDYGSENANPAIRFKDYIFLQRLSSTLRTRLSEDLRSRRRPS